MVKEGCDASKQAGERGGTARAGTRLLIVRLWLNRKQAA